MSQEIGSRHWMYVALLLSIVILGNSFVMFYTTLSPNAELKGLNDQVTSLEAQIRAFNSRLDNGGFVNQSGNDVLPKIFNSTKGSIVLIENRVQTVQGITPQSLGSGFVYSVDSQNQYVVTNNHVVEGSSDLLVTFIDGNSTKASVVGTDPYSDLAVIRLSASMPWLKALALGNSSNLEVGQTVAALGSPFGLAGTMTSGIISQVRRDLDTNGSYKIVDVIQLDAAINPGNSGGPLMNLLGEVLGINTAIISGSNTSSGVGFAIPSDTIAREVPSLIANGRYDHPYLGVIGIDNNYDIAQAANLNVTYGFLIANVTFNSPAAQAGIQGGNKDITVLGQMVRVGGDLIVGVNGASVRQLDDLSIYLERNDKPGDKVTLTIIRGGQKLSIVVTLGIRPSP